MGSIISKHIPNAEATAESTNGSVDNCKLVSMRKVELGLTMNDVAYSALKGEERFKSKGRASIMVSQLYKTLLCKGRQALLK